MYVLFVLFNRVLKEIRIMNWLPLNLNVLLLVNVMIILRVSQLWVSLNDVFVRNLSYSAKTLENTPSLS